MSCSVRQLSLPKLGPIHRRYYYVPRTSWRSQTKSSEGVHVAKPNVNPRTCAYPMSESQTKKDLSDMKTTAWSITMWLTEKTGYTEHHLHSFVQAMPNDWALEGQMEQGTENQKDLHYQLMLKTPQCRGTRIAKFFPKCHIEEARNYHATKLYVHKDEGRKAEFKSVENRSPQWSQVCDQFFDWVLREKTDNGFFGVADEERTKLWDQFIGLCIREGMRIDIIGVNPQYRSCIIRYWNDYVEYAKTRSPVDKIDRQTKDKDQATEERSDQQVVIVPTLAEGGGISSVQIPEIVAPPTIRRGIIKASLPKT